MKNFAKHPSVVALVLLTVFLSTTGFSCTLIPQRIDPKFDPRKPVTLRYWRAFDDSDTMRPLIDAYQKAHPNVTIEYKKLRYEEYERELVQALSEDRGPDLFSIQNNWVDTYQGKILPLPKKITSGSITTTGGFKKKTTVNVKEINTQPEFAPMKIREKYIDVVGEDVIRGAKGSEEVFGLPLYADTLALFYNKTLFRNAGVVEYPKTWEEFKKIIVSTPLRIVNQNIQDTSDIIQAAAAFGGANNVERAPDILSMLMMQSGAHMMNRGMVTFDQTPSTMTGVTVAPAVEALRYYTDFASYAPRKETYTWNEDQPNSYDAFIQGKAAMFFGYSYHQQLIRAQAPQLDYTIVPVPQNDPQRPYTTANYWVETVSKKTANPDYAWDFLMFVQKNTDVLKQYLKQSGHPTALRALVEEEKGDEDITAFAQQLLMAHNWYHGRHPQDMERAFRTMITDALNVKGGSTQEEQQKLFVIIKKAQQAVQETY